MVERERINTEGLVLLCQQQNYLLAAMMRLAEVDEFNLSPSEMRNCRLDLVDVEEAEDGGIRGALKCRES